MKYIWKTFYWIFQIIAFVLTGIIWCLVKVKDFICDIKDWLREKEILG